MFQKEVADRIIAEFNTSAYGRLAILTNWRLNVKKICDIGPECFSPKPKIDSSLLYFVPKDNFIEDSKIQEILKKFLEFFLVTEEKCLKKPFNQLFNGDQKILKKLKIDLSSKTSKFRF